MTRYEIAARHRNGQELLIGYTPHKSRPGLMAAVQKHSLEIIVVLGIGERDEIIMETQSPHCCRIGEWRIVFTGRTEVEAKGEGELPLFNRHHKGHMPPRKAARAAFAKS
jgi:hypothetical protein